MARGDGGGRIEGRAGAPPAAFWSSVGLRGAAGVGGGGVDVCHCPTEIEARVTPGWDADATGGRT